MCWRPTPQHKNKIQEMAKKEKGTANFIVQIICDPKLDEVLAR